MRLPFCVLCGVRENIEHHHVIPSVLGGSNNPDNLISVCSLHHNIIHSMYRKSNIKELQKVGIQKAKTEGKYTGRKPLDPALIISAKQLIDSGMRKEDVANKLNIGLSTLYKYYKYNS